MRRDVNGRGRDESEDMARRSIACRGACFTPNGATRRDLFPRHDKDYVLINVMNFHQILYKRCRLGFVQT
jgi:hypothetical protein